MNEPQLSESQKVCLRLVAAGMSSKEIAIQRGLTPRTVDQYITLAVQSLGASNRRDAARKLAQLEAELPLKREKPPLSREPASAIAVDLDPQLSSVSDDFPQLDDKNRVLEKLQLEPGSIDPPPISVTNEEASPTASPGMVGRFVGWVPPLGGERDELSAGSKIQQIVKASLLAAGTFGTIVTIGVWLQSLFT